MEIGSFEGKSSRIIATALNKGARLLCIDPFRGSPEHSPLLKAASTYDAFLENMVEYIDSGAVEVCRKKSDDALENVTRSLSGEAIGFLCIDGEHSCEQVLRDAFNELPLVADGGWADDQTATSGAGERIESQRTVRSSIPWGDSCGRVSREWT